MKNKYKVGLLALLMLVVTTSGFAATSSNFTVYWSVPASYDHTISYNTNCSGGTAYFVESDALIDGNQWKVIPYDDSAKSNQCQDNTTAYFTITITGTSTSELDINATNTQGEDVNLKIFEADTGGNFCGLDPFSVGWEETCSVTDGAVTNTTCLQVGTGDGEFYSLGTGASASFCMTADFNANGTAVAVGDHEETVGITSRAVD